MQDMYAYNHVTVNGRACGLGSVGGSFLNAQLCAQGGRLPADKLLVVFVGNIGFYVLS